ncbi:MAG: c-type cytochrome [Flavobacteriaceae bacterium]
MQQQIKKLAQNLLVILLAYVGVVVLVFIGLFNAAAPEKYVPIPVTEYQTDLQAAVYATQDRSLQLGYEVLVNTSKVIGPLVADATKRTTGNNLECISCHLNEGTKAFGIPLNTVLDRFPQFRGRENKIGTIEDRINGCLTRSMNGKPLDVKAQEMKALVAFLGWLNKETTKDVGNELYATAMEKGLKPMEWPNRPADLSHGAQVFEQQCVLCHQKNGQGTKETGGQYLYPPLWGNDTYNNGAGMTRLLTAASFIKYNMPFGVSHENPTLTDDEAYDVAAYMNQQQRPEKAALSADFPDRLKKPMSTPYGPYSDPFSAEQHQLGPFGPIADYYKKEFGIIKTK